MASISIGKFNTASFGSEILCSFYNVGTAASTDAALIEQTCLRAAVAQGVGCWEGYIEGVIREFVYKTRLNAHRRAWPLIAQFETIVDKMAGELNTPNWDKTRELLIIIIGIDPQPKWVWQPKFLNSTDTKNFFDGIMNVRHAFAHGFSVSHTIPGLTTPGVLDLKYAMDAIECVRFFAGATDSLLEHELIHRHGCKTGWN